MVLWGARTLRRAVQALSSAVARTLATNGSSAVLAEVLCTALICGTIAPADDLLKLSAISHGLAALELLAKGGGSTEGSRLQPAPQQQLEALVQQRHGPPAGLVPADDGACNTAAAAGAAAAPAAEGGVCSCGSTNLASDATRAAGRTSDGTRGTAAAATAPGDSFAARAALADQMARLLQVLQS